MYKKKVSISEESDFLNLLQKIVQEDYEVIKEVQFHIEFMQINNELRVLIAGLPSVRSKIDEFANHLVNDYNGEIY